MDLLDTIRLLLAVGVTVYAFLTYHRVKGGTVGKPYAILTACGFVGICASAADFLGSDIAHDLLGIIFYLLLFVGFMFLYKSDELTQSLDRLRILMNALPAFISYIDPEQRYLFTNKLYTIFFGQEISQLRGAHVREVLGDQAYQKTRPHIEAALRGERQSYEYELPHGKEIRHIKAAYVPDMEEGNVKGIFALEVDITEQMQAENALRNSEERYRRLFENSPISLWEEDYSEIKKYLDRLRSEGIKDLRKHFIEHPEDLTKCASVAKILDVNRATLVLYGAKSVEELRGELSKIFTPGSQDNFIDELIALSEGRARFAGEFDNRTLRGEIKHVSLISTVIPGYEDTFGKVLISIIDLTERKRMEEKLAKAERLSAIGETAAMVGHDLRSPLQGINSATYLLRDQSLTKNARDELLQLIDENVARSNRIIADLLDYSGELHLALSETTPREIARSGLVAVKIPDTIRVQDQCQEQPKLLVDLDRMKRVFINLIQNAVDAMPTGGILAIRSKESNCCVEITVSDTGTGLAKEIQENLWRPLQTTKAKGIGLGLPICKRFVDAHDGEITVETKQNEGTTFTIRLPIKTAGTFRIDELPIITR